MTALPWLVRHGAALWHASLVLFVLAGLGFASLRTRLVARGAARAARARLGPPRPLPETAGYDGGSRPQTPGHDGGSRPWAGTRVTLAGQLEAADGLCPRYEDGSAAAAVSGPSVSARADRMLLRVGDALVRLEGPIDVVAGSREAWPGRALKRLPAAVRRRVEGEGRACSLPEAPVFRSLAPGDRVLISGVLGDEAADEAPTYRTTARRWTLGGALVAAFDGEPRVSGPAAVVRIRPAVAGALVFLVGFGAAGEIAMTFGAREITRLEVAPSFSGGGLDAVAVAAATPFRRAGALATLVRALDARRDPDRRSLAAREALHTLLDERAEVAAMWIAQGEPTRGARLAEDVMRPAVAARGWYAAGNFAEAAEAWERAGAGGDEAELRFGVGVHLFAGRLDRAAQAARRLAAALRAHPADGERLQRWYATRAETATCLADALDARRGDAAAWQALHAERTAPLPPACAVLRLDLFDGADRIEALRALPALSQSAWDVPSAWLEVLASEADPAGYAAPPLPFPFDDDPARALLVPNEGVPELALPGVDEHLAESLVPYSARRAGGAHEVWAQATASAALFALLAGDDARARTLAHRLQADGLTLPIRCRLDFIRQEQRSLDVEALVGMLADDHALAAEARPASSEVLQPLMLFRRDGDPRLVLESLAERPAPDEDEKEAWVLAGQGDGHGLARWLRRSVAQPGIFLRFGAPLLQTGRAAVGLWVRSGYRPPAGFHPTEEVVHLATLASAAEALDQPDAAASLRERAKRFRRAILRRETAVPLAVLERL